jgi:excisionase family DNA binding protein
VGEEDCVSATTAPAPRLLTAKEVADYFGMSSAWVLDRWEDGTLPGYQLSSRAIRFRIEEIEEWLAKRRRPGYAENALPGQRPATDTPPGREGE